MKSLSNKEFKIIGNWYEPITFLRSFSSSVGGGLYDTTSSCGDWSGFIIQQMGKKSFHIIYFNQENNMNDGFNISTRLIGQTTTKPTNEECFEFINELMF